MTSGPREDALAKAREALALGRRWTTEHLGNCSEDDTPDEVSKIKEDLADIDDAIASLAALSAPPSQSESDALRDATARTGALHFALAVADAAINPTDKAGISLFDWNERLKKATVVIRQALALTPSPTPYVRPAAEIRAEIERVRKLPPGERAAIRSGPYLAGLTFALTLPTQEPR